MGLFDPIRNQFDDEPGGGLVERGPLEGSSNIVEQQYRIATGAADYARAVWNDPRYSPNDNASEERMRDSFQLTGASRTAYDWITDYQGTWGGSEDSVDVVGPPVFGAEGSVLDVLVQQQGEEHGARETSTMLLLVGGAIVVLLYLLGPVIGPLLDAALGGDDE